MKKINKKQRFIMRLAGTFLFVVALILTLDLIFSNKKIDKKFIGTWEIGYEVYKGKTEDELLYKFEQELHLLKDGSFFTIEKYIPGGEGNNKVSGKYEVNDNILTLKYLQKGETKTDILVYKSGKLCLNSSCKKYYKLNKIENYFPVYNAGDQTTSEE